MAELGYKLSSEEHAPRDLIRHAQMAEKTGFSFAMISDHYHPWIDKQGHAPFVWSILGGLAQATHRLHFATGVTCPTIRIHPAIIAQASATTACLMPGRFTFAVGTGENLNEHILGDKWPPYDIRAEMLEEAVEIIRLLWEGKQTDYRGIYYTVENARLYDLPDELPAIVVAAGGANSAELAAEIGDGLVTTSPDREVIQTYKDAGGEDKPIYGEVSVCWAKSEEEAIRTALEIWPNAGLQGELSQELPLPAHFKQASKSVKAEDITKTVVCGPDPRRHLKMLQTYFDAGVTHLAVHQIGPDQAGFFRFYEREILPQLNLEGAPALSH